MVGLYLLALYANHLLSKIDEYEDILDLED